MAELATMARPYANAVFGIARQDNDLERWSRMLRFLAVASADPQVKLLLDSPEVPDEQKGFRLAEVCGDELNDRARKLTQVLASNKRLDLVDEIREQFEVLRAADKGYRSATIGKYHSNRVDEGNDTPRTRGGFDHFAGFVEMTAILCLRESSERTRALRLRPARGDRR